MNPCPNPRKKPRFRNSLPRLGINGGGIMRISTN
jgi:hypothetical protein